MDMGGHTVRSGEQAIIRAGGPGRPNEIEIVKIPPAEAPQLDDKVAMACMAKKTVYFEVTEKKDSTGNGSEAAGGPVSAFNDQTDSAPSATELVPVIVVPINQDTDVPLSTARIIGQPGS
jgi:hypothetical protein